MTGMKAMRMRLRRTGSPRAYRNPAFTSPVIPRPDLLLTSLPAINGTTDSTDKP